MTFFNCTKIMVEIVFFFLSYIFINSCIKKMPVVCELRVLAIVALVKVACYGIRAPGCKSPTFYLLPSSVIWGH